MSNDKKGWIALHRSIQDHYFWDDKPFSKGQAWIDLIMLANHEDKKTIYQGKLVEFKRGTVNRSILSLAERWGWDRKKTRKFIDLMESDGMVTTNRTTHGTTITLVNYGKYQDIGTTNGTTKGTTTPQQKGQPLPTNNNVNNVNNEEQDNIGAKRTTKKSSSQFKPPTVEEIREYIEIKGYSMDPEDFYDYYSAGGWTLSNGRKMKDWKAAVNRWNRNQSNWGKCTTDRRKVEENSDKGEKYRSVFEDYKNI